MAKPPDRPKKQPTGDYTSGYARPPVHTRIKPGEVRNPHGRNGKMTGEPDAFEKVRTRKSRVTIDGETILIPSDEAFYLLQFTRALAGDKAAAKIVAQELAARRKIGPSAEELAQEAAENEQRRILSAKLVGLLNEKAGEKHRRGNRLAAGEPIEDEDDGEGRDTSIDDIN